jgi:hypothetical protein
MPDVATRRHGAELLVVRGDLDLLQYPLSCDDLVGRITSSSLSAVSTQ